METVEDLGGRSKPGESAAGGAVVGELALEGVGNAENLPREKGKRTDPSKQHC